ncbi:MAG: S8 family serine peptidase [Desulfobacteraceae bacterium]|nr:S8 family serine peptidase [Desulfobacteraceae bacterium]
MKKIICVFNIILFTLLCATGVFALEFRMAHGKLSLRANRTPLQDILQRMADTGISIQIDPRLNPAVSASFKNRDIQEGLNSILKSVNYVLIWKSVQGESGNIIKLDEIQVFMPGKKELMKPLGKRSVLSIARNPKDGSLFVKGEILLRLKPGADISKIKKFLEQTGGTVTASNPALGIYKIRVPENSDIPAVAEQLSGYPGVKSEPNYAYPISMPYMNASANHDFSLSDIPLPDGKIPIAVLDTGLDTDSVPSEYVLASLDAVNMDTSISDSLGHGTQMALIASGVVEPYGVVPSSVTGEEAVRNPVIAIRAFDDNGFTSNYNIMDSVNFALENGARVMSLSWGSETRSDFMEDAMNYANSKGLVIVASAGNEPTGKPRYPAAYESVICVGALNPEGKRWENSNYGDFVNLYAPGFATLPVGYKGDPGAYAGTSISTAYEASRIADYLSKNPEASKQEIYNALQKP